jgi:tripeptide aminopeptidase
MYVKVVDYKNIIKERFLQYVRIDTQSNPKSGHNPSTEGQMALASILKDDLVRMGVEKVKISDYGYLTATIPATTKEKVPVVGFIAHLDTASEISGKQVDPQIFENFDGKRIAVNKKKQIVLDSDDFPQLKKYKGHTIITADGNTLLGADDKAGIAAIMTAVEYMLNNEFPHGTIKIAFTPDEEIARGTDYFDVEKFGADFAYTVDGGELGELEYETFNAAEAKVIINGYNIHPGYAKGRMINSIRIGMELNAMLPVQEKPEYTAGYEGFFHITEFDGTVEKTIINYLIRDHDINKFGKRKQLLNNAVSYLNKKYGRGTIRLKLTDQYYNMREKIEPVMHVVELAKKAMEAAGIKPLIKPIRGGTDGAKLTFKGLPSPNIFTGGYNFHSKYEYTSIEAMHKAFETILKIAELNVKHKKA